MALAHIYFNVNICAAYTVEVPDGMDAWEVAHKLDRSPKFNNEHLIPDLNDCDWNDCTVEVDDYTDEVDFTAEQVLGYVSE